MSKRRARLVRPELDARARARRKRYLLALLITSIALSIIGGGLHVITLGDARIEQMRARASYDLSEEHKHIRAAGEEIYRQLVHEQGRVRGGYTQEQAQALLHEDEWAELETMIRIPAGPFTMGTDNPRTNAENRPAHRVRLPAYWIDKYPVTNAQYARFVAATGHRPPLHWEQGRIPRGLLRHPVTMVSWLDARDYCRWAGKRLPTEAEWEKAARGPDARIWPWGNQMDPKRLNTYYQVGHTTPVDAYPSGASPYGVMDMAGNVQEWTASRFAPYPGSDAPATLFVPKAIDPNYHPSEEEKGKGLSYRVMRGGSWKSDPFSTAAYHRNYSLPNYAADFYGFRCAKDDEGEAR